MIHRFIALGGGVQSSYLLWLANVEHWDVQAAIFADTGYETPETYAWLQRISQESSISVAIAREPRDLLGLMMEDKKLPLPAFVRKPSGAISKIRRDCTRDWKIRPLAREYKRQMGLPRRARFKGHEAVVLLGISSDEAHRRKPSGYHWQKLEYPLVERGISRKQCKEELPWGTPPRSACWFCPHASDKRWRDIRDRSPKEWKRAIALDQHIRTAHERGVFSLENAAYLHSACIPLEEVKFESGYTVGLEEECTGHCGI